MSNNNLSIVQLKKKYPLNTKGKNKLKREYKIALKNISLELENGLYGLLGPNGAGKSTLINLITMGDIPNSGYIQWNGKNIKKLNKQYRRILGYMPQQQNLYENFSGKQFLQYMCALKEIPRDTIDNEIKRCADAVNLSDRLNQRLGTYSGGMKQRLLAASAIIGNPKLLIFDEPTAGLDPKERVRLRTFMKELSSDSIVITATHVVSDVESVADKIILLKEGSIIDIAPVNELIEKYAPGHSLEQVYLNIFGEE